ncbi:MAG: hypothetical protein K8L97_00955 [Anaerolineae bacterium]|nr:hypothetical protein [Anaerolineae bacterium]
MNKKHASGKRADARLFSDYAILAAIASRNLLNGLPGLGIGFYTDAPTT